MEFEAWFKKATGQEPYPYQIRFAMDVKLPDLVDVPMRWILEEQKSDE